MRRRLLSLLLAGIAGTGVTSAGAATPPATAEIYLQRAGDGRIVLTDRPSPTAVTERSWQLEREDPEAARRRALDVRREAEAVSRRIQRRLDEQQRLDAELDQSRLAQHDRALAAQLARERAEREAGPVLVAPFDWQPGYRQAPIRFERPPRRDPNAPWRGPRVKAPASPESR